MNSMMMPQFYVTVVGRPHGVWQGPAIPLWPVRTAEVQQVVVPTLFAHLTKAGHVVYDVKLGIYRISAISKDHTHVTLDPTDPGVTLAYGRLGIKDNDFLPRKGEHLTHVHLDFYEDGKVDDQYVSIADDLCLKDRYMSLECYVQRGKDLRNRVPGKDPFLANMLFRFNDIFPESLTDLYKGVLKNKEASK